MGSLVRLGGMVGQPWHNVAPPSAKKPSWKVVTALIVGLLVVFLIGTAVTNMSKNGTTDSIFASEPAAMNQNVSDGKFRFRVTGVERSSGVGLAKPRGEFVLVAMTVTNEGKKSSDVFCQQSQADRHRRTRI